ncbi:MAG: acyltransferase [bacterium]|nr:acyltransferase [bacterium]
MAGFLKRTYWDLKDPIGRFNFGNAIWSRLPGLAGQELRGRVIPRYFAAAGTNIIIHEGVRFRGIHRLEVGDECHLGNGCFLQASGGITLGKRVIIGPDVRIWSINHVTTDTHRPIADQGYHYENVVIGDDCWLGMAVIVLPGVHLPEGCVVSAGSVVGKKAYPAWSVLAGHPARVIQLRRAGDSTDVERTAPAVD